MKKNLLSKLFTLFALAFAGGALASCESVAKEDAKIVVVKESEAHIYVDTKDGKTYATATIGIENNTIYDVYSWDLTYVAIIDGVEKEDTTNVKMYVTHGASGHVTFLEEVDAHTTSAKIISGSPKEMANIMETYMGWWVAGFAAFAFSTILFGYKLFSDTFTKEQAKEMLKEHMAGSLFVTILITIVVLLPLVMGSWFPTVILGGMVVASILVNSVMTGIKELTSKY